MPTSRSPLFNAPFSATICQVVPFASRRTIDPFLVMQLATVALPWASSALHGERIEVNDTYAHPQISPLNPARVLGKTRPGSTTALMRSSRKRVYLGFKTVSGNDRLAILRDALSVAFNWTVNLPARLSSSRNCKGMAGAFCGTSLLTSPTKGLAVGLPFSSRTVMVTVKFGWPCAEARPKPTALKLIHRDCPSPTKGAGNLPAGSLV